MMNVKVLNIKVDFAASEHIEDRINETLEKEDIFIGQVINIQYLTGGRVMIFYREI